MRPSGATPRDAPGVAVNVPRSPPHALCFEVAAPGLVVFIAPMDRTAKPVILVVEDEPLVLIHSHLALEDAGYHIVAARDAAEALEHLSARDDIRALFTDVQLPGVLDGLALARRVSAERPEIAIVVTSGSVAIEPGDLPAASRFIAKPYNAMQVVRMLDAAT